MSELRRDPFTGRWTIIAEGRGARPNEHSAPAPVQIDDPDCPFCEGHEARTPPELAALRPTGSRPDGPGWSIRVIPNKFPTVDLSPARPLSRAPFQRAAARGVHEVVIESPRHAPGMPYLDAAARRSLFRMYRERLRLLESRSDIAGAVLFENWGPESGGTLWHPHAQLVATEQRPRRLEEEAARFGPGSSGGGDDCPLEATTRAERTEARRVIVEDEHFTTVAPFGSEHPYEMRIVPRVHRPSLAQATEAEVDALADRLPALLRALDAVVPGASFNWCAHGLPERLGAPFHWHIEVVPRLVRPDGFELAGELPVNPVSPETAAERLAASLASTAGSGAHKS